MLFYLRVLPCWVAKLPTRLMQISLYDDLRERMPTRRLAGDHQFQNQNLLCRFVFGVCGSSCLDQMNDDEMCC